MEGGHRNLWDDRRHIIANCMDSSHDGFHWVAAVYEIVRDDEVFAGNWTAALLANSQPQGGSVQQPGSGLPAAQSNPGKLSSPLSLDGAFTAEGKPEASMHYMLGFFVLFLALVMCLAQEMTADEIIEEEWNEMINERAIANQLEFRPLRFKVLRSEYGRTCFYLNHITGFWGELCAPRVCAHYS